MIQCLDIHTHHPAPQPMAVISASIDNFNPIDGQLYSIGIHPWDTDKQVSIQMWQKLEELAQLPCVVAIGETGIDKLKGAPLYRQLYILNRHIQISEKLKKPLIIHDVRAHDVIVGLRREMSLSQKWAIHGFRYKPTVAKMMTDAGIFLSFGETFNPDSLISAPDSLILAETDESSLSIQEIISNLSSAYGQDITPLIAKNTSNFLFDNEISI